MFINNIFSMKAQKVYEALGDILKPKTAVEVLNQIKNMSVSEKIKRIQQMQKQHGQMYKGLLQQPEVVADIRNEVKKELQKIDVIEKVNYIEEIEKQLPDIFSGMKDDGLLKELKDYILNKKDFNEKAMLVWRFFKSWPDLFRDVEDDPRVDPETNQIMLLFKIKGAIDRREVDNLQELIHEMGEKYGRSNILDKAANITIPESGRYGDNKLFNKKDIEQLKLSLYRETRSEEEALRDEYYDVYAFIGYPEFIEKEIGGETVHKRRMGIENLVKLNKYDSGSLSQVPMMKIRAAHQYQHQEGSGVWAVYIPKYMWNKDYAHNDEIPDDLRKFIDENKFKL